MNFMLNPSFHAILKGTRGPGFGALRSIGAVWNDPTVGQKKHMLTEVFSGEGD